MDNKNIKIFNNEIFPWMYKHHKNVYSTYAYACQNDERWKMVLFSMLSSDSGYEYIEKMCGL